MTHTSDLRAQLEQAVIRDLLGPANGPEEIVDERAVRERYLLGKLGPQGQSPIPDFDEILTVDDVEGEKLVADALASHQDHWDARIAQAQGGARLGYQARRDGVTVGLLTTPQERDWDMFTCLNSLRDVEPTANLILNNYGMEQGEDRSWGAPPPADKAA